MSTSPARILVSVFGSAGDLFPMVPIILKLRESGVDVRCAVPRSLGLYLRLLGVPTFALGDGAELSVVNDRRIFTTRFDGWSSWRRTLVHYVGPTIQADVERIDGLLTTWRPDIVVTSGFAVAARVAADQHGLPLMNCSIYPQHEEVDAQSCHQFARPFTQALNRISNGGSDLRRLMFGAPSEVVLHDPALLGSDPSAERAVGFPYWDEVPARPADLDSAERLLRRPGHRVLVTLGSFVGLAQQRAWEDAAHAVRAVGASALFVGARSDWATTTFDGRDDIQCIGFAPLSSLMPRFDTVIHHGGIGTTMAALRSARPAVVLPQAFDQSANARLVERVGGGLDGSRRPLAESLAPLLADEAARVSARALAKRLRPTSHSVDATTRVVSRVFGESL